MLVAALNDRVDLAVAKSATRFRRCFFDEDPLLKRTKNSVLLLANANVFADNDRAPTTGTRLRLRVSAGSPDVRD
jgi:hypothetical protein